MGKRVREVRCGPSALGIGTGKFAYLIASASFAFRGGGEGKGNDEAKRMSKKTHEALARGTICMIAPKRKIRLIISIRLVGSRGKMKVAKKTFVCSIIEGGNK